MAVWIKLGKSQDSMEIGLQFYIVFVEQNDLVFLKVKAIWHKIRYIWPRSLKIVGNLIHCSSVDCEQ